MGFVIFEMLLVAVFGLSVGATVFFALNYVYEQLWNQKD